MAKINLNLFSCYLKRNVHVDIILPSKDFLNVINKDFEYQDKKYKSLYLLHGTGDNEKVWSENTSIDELAQKYGVVVIMPSAENTYYTDTTYSVFMKSFIEKELYSFINSNFPVSKNKEDIHIVGNSMGGYGALKIALSNLDKFGNCASFSGGLDVVKQVNSRLANIIDFKAVFGDITNLDQSEHSIKYLLNNNIIKDLNIYLTCGDEDQNLLSTKEIVSVLDDKKISYKFIEDKGGHTWSYWDKQIKDYFEFVFKK